MFWLLVCAALAIFYYVKFYKPHQYWKSLNVPYIKPWPLIGSMPQFVFQLQTMADWVHDLYNTRNERVTGFYAFLSPILMIKDINLIKQLGIKEFDHFVNHRTIMSEEIDPLFGKNLFMLKGQKWRNMRSTLSPAFTSSKMRLMFNLINDCAKQFMTYFQQKVPSDEPLVIEMKDTFTRFANDVIASTAFGIKCDSLAEQENEFYMHGKDATNFGGLRSLKFFGYNVSVKLMQVLKVKVFSEEVATFFRNIIKTNIATREKEGIVRQDMIHLLMEARKGKLKHEDKKDDDAGFATVNESDVGKQVIYSKPELTDDDVTAQALLFFIAGFDTISSAMGFMAYELALNEDIQERLQDEIDTTIKECDGKLSYETVLKMKYLDMVLTETLRKWPSVPSIDRECTEDYTIPAEQPGEHPITLKKKDVIWFPVYGIHHDPQYYPDPEKFDPERFSDENKANINPLTYIPFGVGPRNCIGSRFALMEAKIIFINILSKFSLVVVKRTDIPIQLKTGSFTMLTKNGIWLGLQKRNNK